MKKEIILGRSGSFGKYISDYIHLIDNYIKNLIIHLKINWL